MGSKGGERLLGTGSEVGEKRTSSDIEFIHGDGTFAHPAFDNGFYISERLLGEASDADGKRNHMETICSAKAPPHAACERVFEGEEMLVETRSTPVELANNHGAASPVVFDNALKVSQRLLGTLGDKE